MEACNNECICKGVGIIDFDDGKVGFGEGCIITCNECGRSLDDDMSVVMERSYSVDNSPITFRYTFQNCNSVEGCVVSCELDVMLLVGEKVYQTTIFMMRDKDKFICMKYVAEEADSDLVFNSRFVKVLNIAEVELLKQGNGLTSPCKYKTDTPRCSPNIFDGGCGEGFADEDEQPTTLDLKPFVRWFSGSED